MPTLVRNRRLCITKTSNSDCVQCHLLVVRTAHAVAVQVEQRWLLWTRAILCVLFGGFLPIFFGSRCLKISLVGMVMTSVGRGEFFEVFACHHVQLFPVFYFLSLDQLLNHLSIEYHLNRPSINFILTFAAADHIINTFDVLLIFIVSTLKVRLPPFTLYYKVLIVSLHS